VAPPSCSASSAPPHEVDHYVDLLDARGIADAWTTAGEVEHTKPAPDIVTSALDKVDGDAPAVMVGDSTFDCEAAQRAGVDTIAVLTGGFSDAERLRAGATIVFHSIVELRERLSWTPLG
jgi:phosphoglycolate phosphatase-like HAD superfamily hydrolase